jgi:hypothetical protein
MGYSSGPSLVVHSKARPIHENNEPLGCILGHLHHYQSYSALATCHVRSEDGVLETGKLIPARNSSLNGPGTNRFSRFFTAWIVISLIYLWFTLFVGNFGPLVDGGLKKIWSVLRGQAEVANDKSPGTASPGPESATKRVQKEETQISVTDV